MQKHINTKNEVMIMEIEDRNRWDPIYNPRYKSSIGRKWKRCINNTLDLRYYTTYFTPDLDKESLRTRINIYGDLKYNDALFDNFEDAFNDMREEYDKEYLIHLVDLEDLDDCCVDLFEHLLRWQFGGILYENNNLSMFHYEAKLENIMFKVIKYVEDTVPNYKYPHHPDSTILLSINAYLDYKRNTFQ